GRRRAAPWGWRAAGRPGRRGCAPAARRVRGPARHAAALRRTRRQRGRRPAGAGCNRARRLRRRRRRRRSGARALRCAQRALAARGLPARRRRPRRSGRRPVGAALAPRPSRLQYRSGMPRRADPPTTPDLLAGDSDALRPLAERMRPRSLDEMVGQRRLLAPGSALRRAIESGRVHSMILWGPPGCGKTTLALLLAQYADAEFRAISAVLSGLPDVRKVLAEAESRFAGGRRTVLFVDEVHRFNKAQQDAFLTHSARRTILSVGAPTENPSFELNSALLSRCRVHVMEALSVDDIVLALEQALADEDRGLGGRGLQVGRDQLALIAQAADGDVRRALTLLEIAAEVADEGGAGKGGSITDATLAQVLA